MIWAGVFLLALGLRVWQIDRLPLWLDETTLITMAQQPMDTLARQVLVGQPTPPLYFLLMGLWMPIGPPGEVWARLPAALFGAAFVPATAWLAGELGGRRAALFAALLALVNPVGLWYSQEARPYALAMALGAMMLAIQVRFLKGGSFKWLPALAVTTVVFEATHFAAALVLVIATAIALGFPASANRRGWTFAALWIGAIPLLFTQEARDYLRTVTSALTTPSGETIIARATEVQATLGTVSYPWTRLIGGPAIGLVPALGTSLAILAGAGLLAAAWFGGRPVRLLLFGFALGFGIALLFPQTRQLINDRYLSLTVGPLLAGAAAALAGRSRLLERSVLASMLLLFLAADAIYWFDPRVGKGPDYREPARYLAQAVGPSDVLVEVDADGTFLYYTTDVFGAPVAVYRPRTTTSGASPAEIAVELAAATRGAASIWYMPRWSEGYWDPQQVTRGWLEQNLCLDAALRFDVVELRRYRASGC